MNRTTRIRHLLPLAILAFIPVPAHAIPAITCHCFTDRSYDPARPAVADPYFLATTQNSFFAAVFNVDRKTIVLKKQLGTSADDLWVAYGIAARTGMAPERLLQARQDYPSWHDALAGQHLSAQTAGELIYRALQAGASDSGLAEAVVDDLLLRHRLIGAPELRALRKRGATNQELIIATVIGSLTHVPADELFREVKDGSKSWGALLNAANITAANIPTDIAYLLKQHRG